MDKRPVSLPYLPDNPLVSIVVPSYNQGAFIRDTIESCLSQSYRPIEVIVMDGASSDETVDVLKSFEGVPALRWKSEPDKGVVDAVNKGMVWAKGSICAIQSSDDFYLPDAIAQVVSAFHENPHAALIYADTIKVDADGAEQSRFVTGPFSITRFLSKQTLVLQPAAFFRKEAFMQIGGWSSEYFNADTECWLRMILEYPAVKKDAFWACRRMHEAQRDHQREIILKDYEKMTQANTVLVQGPGFWKRAAKCGLIRHTLRYGTAQSAKDRKRALWRAIRAWPPVLGDPEVAGCVLPFYYAIRRRLPRGKRHR